MTDQPGLVVEECKRCPENPNTCENSTIYKQVRTALEKSQRAGHHYNTSGLTCYEILALLQKEAA